MSTNEITLSIARDFSPFPAGRKRDDGPFAGEQFREDKLLPLLRAGRHVTLNLDGVEGLPSSFLEEVFGGLVRLHRFNVAALKDLINFESTDPELKPYSSIAWRFAEDAQKAH